MKLSFVLSVVLLLALSDASDFISPSEPPVMSPTSSESSNLDCSSVIYSMVDCLSFLTAGSTDLSPTKSCCVGVESVIDYSPQCLCIALESSREMGFVLDNTRALSLPSTCNIHLDPRCDVASSPVSSTPAPSMVSPSASPPTSSPPSKKSPAVTSSPPELAHSLPPKSAAPPAKTESSPTKTATAPAMAAPSPSISSAVDFSVPKVLAIVIVSCFAYIAA